jgi:hypothetical protein
MAKTFYVPGNGTASSQSQTPPINNVNNTGQGANCPAPKKMGLTTKQWTDLAVCSIFPALLYGIMFYILSGKGVNFFLSNVIGCVLAIMLLSFLKSVLKMASDLSTPITIIMAFILILTLSIHYLPDYKFKRSQDNDKPKNAWTPGMEVLRFTDSEQLITNHTFSKGKEVRIRVVGTSVNLLSAEGSQELIPEYGVYVFQFNSDAYLTMTGNGGESTVTIRW